MKSVLLNMPDELFLDLTSRAKLKGVSRNKLIAQALEAQFKVQYARPLTESMKRLASTTHSSQAKQVFLPVDVIQVMRMAGTRSERNATLLEYMRVGSTKIADNPELLRGFYKIGWKRLSVHVDGALLDHYAKMAFTLRTSLADLLSVSIIQGLKS